jgi:hypothetical protein
MQSAFSRECGADDYHILRHLFNEAMKSSVSDKRWHLFATFSNPGVVMFTEYEHCGSGDHVSCQSFGYADEVYKTHIFTFKQAIDCED